MQEQRIIWGLECLMIFRNAEKCLGGSRNLSGQ